MSNRKIVNLKDFAREIKDYEKRSEKELREATARGVARSIPMLIAASPVDTGLYAQSWDFTVQEKAVILGNYAPYAGVIEYGARPFTPPIGPLLEWAKRVTGSGSQPPDYDDQVWALARHTQQKIAREGMQPHHVMEKMIPKIIENIKRELQRG